MSRLLYRLGAWCARRKVVVFLAWLAVIALVAAGVVAFGLRTNNDVTLPGTGAQHASDILRQSFPPQQNSQSPVVFHATQGKVTDAGNKRAIESSLAAIAHAGHVATVTSPFSPRAGKPQVSADGTTAVAEVLLDVNGFQLTKQVAASVMAGADPARKAGLQVEAGGSLGTVISQTKPRGSELIGTVAAVIILAFTFGSLVAAGLPLVTALIGLGIGLGLVGLLGHLVAIPDSGPTVAAMIGLGVGIDYALFIVFRHRDELAAGTPVAESIARTMATSGSAVVFAGCTVIIALLALLVSRVPLLGAMGYAAGIAVLVAVLAAITLLPALLSLLGHRIDGLRLGGRRAAVRQGAGAATVAAGAAGETGAQTAATAAGETGAQPAARSGADNVWGRWAALVTRHPWLALGAALLVMVPLALPTLTLKLGQEDVGVTPTSTTQRRAFDLVSSALGPGANGPLAIVSRFDPVATPSTEYTTDNNKAQALKRQIDAGRRSLSAKSAALKKEQAALTADQAALQAQSAQLRAGQSALQSQAAALQAQRSQLLGEEAALTARKDRLAAESQALAARGKALAAQIAAVQPQIAASSDPAQVAQLEAQLAALAAQAQSVRAQSAALQKEAAPLVAQGKRLAAQGDALAAQGDTLSAQGAALQAKANDLAAQGAALKRRAASLTSRADQLRQEQRRLTAQGKQAEALKKKLTDMLTKAGGEARATDPRVVALQDALARTAGVASVSPPRIDKGGDAVMLGVTATTRPADPKTVALVRRLRDTVIPAATKGQGVTAYVGGKTAAFVDLATLIGARLPLVIATVLALSFLVLLLAFRSLLVPLKAILCNLLAVAAAFGIITAVFQWGWGLSLVGLANPYGTVPIVSYVPLLMFAVLFGMSTDYEVFLISQIFQFHAAGQGPHEAVRSGVGTSARVITAAAAIMVTVFASFVLNGDPVIKEFGVGLSIAILLDATIVRLVIVPATMVLLGEWNWYLPRWLQWLPRIDLPQEAPAGGAGEAPAGEAAPAG